MRTIAQLLFGTLCTNKYEYRDFIPPLFRCRRPRFIRVRFYVINNNNNNNNNRFCATVVDHKSSRARWRIFDMGSETRISYAQTCTNTRTAFKERKRISTSGDRDDRLRLHLSWNKRHK